MPNDDLAVVERAYNPNRGIIGVRIAHVKTDDLKKGAKLRSEILADLKPPLTLDNFEGIACRADAQGRSLFYILSDNNFSDSQRTLLLLFALAD